MNKIKLKPEDFAKQIKKDKLDKKAEARRKIEDLKLKKLVEGEL